MIRQQGFCLSGEISIMNNGACSICSKRRRLLIMFCWEKRDRLAQFPPRIRELNFNDHRLLSNDATFSEMHSRKKIESYSKWGDNIGREILMWHVYRNENNLNWKKNCCRVEKWKIRSWNVCKFCRIVSRHLQTAFLLKNWILDLFWDVTKTLDGRNWQIHVFTSTQRHQKNFSQSMIGKM